MQHKAIIVIGSNYGDEGKGALVNHLVAQTKSNCVVRFNGGPQAGHTVQLKNGKRHVFSSLGAGSFQGATTFISEHCLFNPISLLSERLAFEEKTGIKTKVVVSPKAAVITPWDIIANQVKEKGRGTGKHGSCGMGIGEAEFRRQNPDAPKLVVEDLTRPEGMLVQYQQLRLWMVKVIKEAEDKGELFHLTPTDRKVLSEIISYPSKVFTQMVEYSASTSVYDIHPFRPRDATEYIVMEGAQGLLLDQDNAEHYPHVTWSKTGLKNAVEMCKTYGVEVDQVFYVTRPYLTRHGAGPMYAAAKEIPNSEVEWDTDQTNKPNEFQDHLRYGHMDWAKFKQRILKDAADNGIPPEKVNFAVTCEDHIYSTNTQKYLWFGDSFEEIAPEDFFDKLSEFMGITGISIDGRKG